MPFRLSAGCGEPEAILERASSSVRLPASPSPRRSGAACWRPSRRPSSSSSRPCAGGPRCRRACTHGRGSGASRMDLEDRRVEPRRALQAVVLADVPGEDDHLVGAVPLAVGAVDRVGARRVLRVGGPRRQPARVVDGEADASCECCLRLAGVRRVDQRDLAGRLPAVAGVFERLRLRAAGPWPVADTGTAARRP